MDIKPNSLHFFVENGPKLTEQEQKSLKFSTNFLQDHNKRNGIWVKLSIWEKTNGL